MIIRQAQRGDIPIIAGFQMAMALETENLTLDPDKVAKGVAAVFDKPSRGFYYVAEDKDKIAGCLLTTFEWSDWRNGTVLWIQSVYVLPDYRRQGIYAALYRYVKNLVENDPDLFGIRLYADISNTVAHKAYIKMGMNGDHYKTFEWMK